MSKNYHKILGVSSNATPEEIKKAFMKLALKHHPDKGGLKEKFQEIKEAYDYLSNKKGGNNFTNSNDINDILEEIERVRVQNQTEMIEIIEKAFILFGVSPQNLDLNLWSGYSDWREKLEKLAEMPVVDVPTEFTKFQTLLYDKIVEIGKKKSETQKKNVDSKEEVFKKNLQNQQEEHMQMENNYWQEPEKEQQNFPSPTPPSQNDNSNNNPALPTNDQLPNDKPSRRKPKLSNSDWVKFLEEEIKYHEKNLLELPLEIEKKECRKKIDDLKKQLEWAKKNKEDNQNNPQTDNDNNENYDNWTHEQLVKEIEKLKSEIEALKKDKNTNDSQKQSELRKKIEKLEKLEKEKANSVKDNKFPTSWVFGGGVLLIGLVLTALIIVRNNKKKRENSPKKTKEV